MFTRSSITFLLIMALSVATSARSPVQQEYKPAQEQKIELTPDEDREARALAEEFIERLEKSGDVTPLVKDLYVNDFTDRLRSSMDRLFPLAATPEVAAQMSSDDLLRAYTASINCMYLASRLFIEWEQRRKQESASRGEPDAQDNCQHPRISEIIPPNILKLIQSDPFLAALLDEFIREEKAEAEGNDPGDFPTSDTNANEPSSAKESLEETWPFRSLDEMRHYTSLMEQGVKLLREHIDSLPPQLKPSMKEFMSTSKERSTNEEAREPEDVFEIRPHVLESEWMGYSDGTHIICATALIFHLDMVRDTDGRLRVVSVYMNMD